MMADLAAADSAGDTQLAQHIAGQIKAARGGTGESLGRGAAQGATFGFGDEAQGVIQAGLGRALPEALGGFGPEHKTGFADDYRQQRDVARKENADAKDAHGGAYLMGNLLGGLAPAVATGGGAVAGAGKTLAQRLAAAVASGAAYGGASGLGSSDADLTQGDVSGAATDTAKGAATGAALGAGTTLAGAAARPLAGKLRELSTDTARRFLSGTSTSLSRAKPLADSAVEEAFAQGAIRPFGTIKTAAAKLQNAREDVGDVYGKILDALEANGIKGPEAEAMAQQYAAEGRSAAASNTNPAVRRVYDTEAQALRAKEPAGDFTLDRDATGNLKLRQTESIKQSLQDRSRSAYKQQLPDEVGRAHMDAARMMRESTEDAIDRGTQASSDPVVQAIGQQFQPVKQQLSRLIPASDAANAAEIRAAKNHALGLKELLIGAGNPLKTAGAVLAKTRGSSTVASGLRGASNALDYLAPAAQQNTQQAMLAAALRRLALRDTQEEVADAP